MFSGTQIVFLSLFSCLSQSATGFRLQDRDTLTDRCSEGWVVKWFTGEMWEAWAVPHKILKGVQVKSVDPMFIDPLHVEWYNGLRKNKDFDESIAIEKSISEALNGSYELKDCTLIITRLRLKPGCEETLALQKMYLDKKLTHAWMSLGDEHLGCDDCMDFYRSAPLVLRQYYHDSCKEFGWRVVTIPLGFRNEPNVNGSTQASRRYYSWNLLSRNTSYRQRVIERMQAGVPGHYAIGMRHPNFGYFDTMCNSSFTACPAGNVQDTFRFYEALYCRSIPVVEDGGLYFSKFLPKALVQEIITVSNVTQDRAWKTAFGEMRELVRNPEELDKRQQRLSNAWDGYMKQLSQRINKSLERVAST